MSELLVWLGGLELIAFFVLGVAFALDMCSGRARASTRRAVWVLAILVALALPLARLVSPGPAELGGHEVLGSGVITVWSLGAGLGLLRLVHGRWLVKRAVARSRLITAGPWVESLAELGGTRVQLRASEELASPATIGLWRPVILIPDWMRGEGPLERRAVLAHELAHIEGGDGFMLLLAGIVRAIYWVDPLAWLAHRRLRDRCEDAADEAVLAAGVASTRYAHQLVALARARLGERETVAVHGLRRRVLALSRADANPVRPRARVWALPRLVALAAMLAGGMTACEARSESPVVSASGLGAAGLGLRSLQ